MIESFFPGLKKRFQLTIAKLPEKRNFNHIQELTAVMLHRNVFNIGVFNPHLIQICDLEFWTRIAPGIVYVQKFWRRFSNTLTTAITVVTTERSYSTDPASTRFRISS